MSVDYNFVSSNIPEFFNALYNEQAFLATDLKEIRDAFRKKQVLGKTMLLDLVEQQCDTTSKILIVGSWIGFTSFCLYKLGYNNITEVDLDERLAPLTKWVNRFNSSFKHISDDVNNINLHEFDVIINTSCEHMSNSWFDNTPKGTLLVLQSTDYVEDDHINRCISIDEMISKYPMDVLTYKTLDLDYYKRFMLVGRK